MTKFLKIILSLVFAGLLLFIIFWIATNLAVKAEAEKAEKFSYSDYSEKYKKTVDDILSFGLDDVLKLDKVYKLSDSDIIAPAPNPDFYFELPAAESGEVINEKAVKILNGQKLYFNTEIQTFNNQPVKFYLDKTIFAATWKQYINGCIYTISEVKIADASQLRRYLAGGEFGSSYQYVTSDMAKSANAVVAASGDFYAFRNVGLTVYMNKLMRAEGKFVDTCFIDEKGDMSFIKRGEVQSFEEAEQHPLVKAARFSLCFGPALVENHELVAPSMYTLGEVNDRYARSALVQMDSLHYMIVVASGEHYNLTVPTIMEFAQAIHSMGAKHAYALDGGQTAVLVMNNEVINRVVYDAQRKISDIVYFATALPGEA